MKIAIWQQFSSNHSSSFTVVGEFATRDDAERAADEIRAILKTIENWHGQHTEEMEDWWGSGDWASDSSPIEKELAAKYNVEWNGGIDWFRTAKIEIVEDRLVFITPTQRPEADGRSFDQIMNRLGGKGYHEGSIYGDTTAWITFDLTCNAPDESTATAIYDEHLGLHRRIRRSGVHLHFYRWRFDEEPNFPQLVEELKQLGCTEINYFFTQVNLDKGFKLHDETDVELLIEILKNPESYDRDEIVDILGDIGDPRAVEPLIDALQSPDNWLRHSIVNALGKIKDKRAVEPLLRILIHPDETTRYWAVGVLGEIGDQRAIPPLVQLLETTDERLKLTIQEALRKLGHPMT